MLMALMAVKVGATVAGVKTPDTRATGLPETGVLPSSVSVTNTCRPAIRWLLWRWLEGGLMNACSC